MYEGTRDGGCGLDDSGRSPRASPSACEGIVVVIDRTNHHYTCAQWGSLSRMKSADHAVPFEGFALHLHPC